MTGKMKNTYAIGNVAQKLTLDAHFYDSKTCFESVRHNIDPEKVLKKGSSNSQESKLNTSLQLRILEAGKPWG